jgi:hypothetical protein
MTATQSSPSNVRALSADVLRLVPAGAEAGYDALLFIDRAVWKKWFAGSLPEPGDSLAPHSELPTAQVVSVVGSRPQTPCAALLRLQDQTTVTDTKQLRRWEVALRRDGWRPQP